MPGTAYLDKLFKTMLFTHKRLKLSISLHTETNTNTCRVKAMQRRTLMQSQKRRETHETCSFVSNKIYFFSDWLKMATRKTADTEGIIRLLHSGKRGGKMLEQMEKQRILQQNTTPKVPIPFSSPRMNISDMFACELREPGTLPPSELESVQKKKKTETVLFEQ